MKVSKINLGMINLALSAANLQTTATKQWELNRIEHNPALETKLLRAAAESAVNCLAVQSVKGHHLRTGHSKHPPKSLANSAGSQ